MIVEMNESLVTACAKMALKLWPDHNLEQLVCEMADKVNHPQETCFLYQAKDGAYVGWIDLSLRHDYVEGSHTTPVAYIEGIYVEDNYRRHGVASKLVGCAERWGRQHGCREIASDCELDNNLSVDFHAGYGFEEANRLVCFIKSL